MARLLYFISALFYLYTTAEAVPIGLNVTAAFGAKTFVLGTPVQPLATVIVSGGQAPYHYASTAPGPSLPQGLTLDPNTGVISGTPLSIIGPTGFTITVLDSTPFPHLQIKQTSITLTVTASGASPNLASAQQSGAMLDATVAAEAEVGAVDGAIDDAFALNTAAARFENGQFQISMNAGQQKISPASATELVTSWQLWSAGNLVQTEGNLNGSEFIGLAGASKRLTSNALVGIFVGNETANYADHTINRYSAKGTTLGAYTALRWNDGLQAEAQAHVTKLDEAVGFGPITGAYGATRLTLAAGILDDFRFGDLTVAPHLRAMSVAEWQNAYTDSFAVTHARAYFSFGNITAGMQVSQTITTKHDGSAKLYLSVDAEYQFSDARATLTNLDGLRGHLGAGIKIPLGRATVLDFGADAYRNMQLESETTWQAKLAFSTSF